MYFARRVPYLLSICNGSKGANIDGKEQRKDAKTTTTTTGRRKEKKRKIIQIIIPPLNVVQFHERATSYLHLRPFNFPIYWSIHFVHTFCHRRRRRSSCMYAASDRRERISREFATRHANVVTLFCARPRQIMPSGFSEKIAFCASAELCWLAY